MDAKCRAVRQWLRNCTRSQFEAAVYEAKLTPFDEKALRLYINDGMTRNEVGEKLGCSEETIKRSLGRVYRKLSPTT